MKVKTQNDITGDIIVKATNNAYDNVNVSGLSEGAYFDELSSYAL